jgi:hypothetical protein
MEPLDMEPDDGLPLDIAPEDWLPDIELLDMEPDGWLPLDIEPPPEDCATAPPTAAALKTRTSPVILA